MTAAGYFFSQELYGFPYGCLQNLIEGQDLGQMQQQARNGIKMIMITRGIAKNPKYTAICPLLLLSYYLIYTPLPFTMSMIS